MKKIKIIEEIMLCILYAFYKNNKMYIKFPHSESKHGVQLAFLFQVSVHISYSYILYLMDVRI